MYKVLVSFLVNNCSFRSENAKHGIYGKMGSLLTVKNSWLLCAEIYWIVINQNFQNKYINNDLLGYKRSLLRTYANNVTLQLIPSCCKLFKKNHNIYSCGWRSIESLLFSLLSQRLVFLHTQCKNFNTL